MQESRVILSSTGKCIPEAGVVPGIDLQLVARMWPTASCSFRMRESLRHLSGAYLADQQALHEVLRD